MQNQQRPLYVRDILSILENFAPLSLQESYDNAGLICGNPEAEIHSVLLSTDITEEVINEAVQGGQTRKEKAPFTPRQAVIPMSE